MLPPLNKSQFLKFIACVVILTPVWINLGQSKTLAQTTSTSKDTNTPIKCLSGYPDETFQGDRPLTRYEFAAGLNACLEQIDRQIRARNSIATQEDFETTLQRQRELNRELHQLNERQKSSF